MSSHHFVKDGQEPALAILEPIDYPVSELLEWAPLVIISHTVIDHALLWGIKADVVITETQNHSTISEKLNHQQPLDILLKNPGESDLAAAVRHLSSRGQNLVNVCINKPLKDFSEFEVFAGKTEFSVFDSQMRWSMIPSGNFKKWLKKDTVFKVHPGGPIVTGDTTKNTIDHSMIVQNDGLITVKSERLFWFGEFRE